MGTLLDYRQSAMRENVAREKALTDLACGDLWCLVDDQSVRTTVSLLGETEEFRQKRYASLAPKDTKPTLEEFTPEINDFINRVREAGDLDKLTSIVEAVSSLAVMLEVKKSSEPTN